MLELRVDGSRIQRELIGESCEAVFEATALLASALLVNEPGPRVMTPLALPEENVLESPSVDDEPPEVAPDAPAQPVVAFEATPLADTTSPRPRPRLGLGATLGPSFGVLPEVTARVGIHGVLAGKRLQGGVEVAYETPRAGSDTVVQLVSGSLRGCATLGSRLSGGPCFTAEVGAMHGRLRGGDAQTVLWLAPGMGAQVQWMATTRVALLLRGSAQLSAVRPRFVFGDVDGSTRVLHEPAVITGQLLAGASFFFDRK